MRFAREGTRRVRSESAAQKKIVRMSNQSRVRSHPIGPARRRRRRSQFARDFSRAPPSSSRRFFNAFVSSSRRDPPRLVRLRASRSRPRASSEHVYRRVARRTTDDAPPKNLEIMRPAKVAPAPSPRPRRRRRAGRRRRPAASRVTSRRGSPGGAPTHASPAGTDRHVDAATVASGSTPGGRSPTPSSAAVIHGCARRRRGGSWRAGPRGSSSRAGLEPPSRGSPGGGSCDPPSRGEASR